MTGDCDGSALSLKFCTVALSFLKLAFHGAVRAYGTDHPINKGVRRSRAAWQTVEGNDPFRPSLHNLLAADSTAAGLAKLGG